MEERRVGTWCRFCDASRSLSSSPLFHAIRFADSVSTSFSLQKLSWIHLVRRTTLYLFCSSLPSRALSRTHSHSSFVSLIKSNRHSIPSSDLPSIQLAFTCTLSPAEELFDFIISSQPLPLSLTRRSTTKSLAKSSPQPGTTTSLKLRRLSSKAGRFFLLWSSLEALWVG